MMARNPTARSSGVAVARSRNDCEGRGTYVLDGSSHICESEMLGWSMSRHDARRRTHECPVVEFSMSFLRRIFFRHQLLDAMRRHPAGKGLR